MKLILDVKKVAGGRIRVPFSTDHDNIMTGLLTSVADHLEDLLSISKNADDLGKIGGRYNLDNDDEVEVYIRVPLGTKE